MAVFYLPNHDSQVTNDPLGLSDTDGDVTPVWPIIVELLNSSNRPQTPAQIVDLLDTIAYTVHSQSSKDFASLSWFLGELQQGSVPCTGSEHLLLSDVISSIFDLALELPKCFPSGTVHVLRSNETCSFTRKQLGVLLAHQALGTLKCPSWNDWGGVNLGQWYADGGDPKLKAPYITLAFKYLVGLSKESDNSEYSTEVVDFHLHEPESIPNFESLQYPLLQLKVKELETEDDLPMSLTELTEGEEKKESNNALVIACHPLVGHGPTATQEERIIASYPELLPVSVFTPPLGEKTSLIAKTSKGPIFPMGRFEGHGRSATLKELYDPKQRKDGIFNRFIFMDASQQDVGNHREVVKFMERDLIKAYSGFLGALRDLPRSCHINFVTLPWGAGAFGGNLLTNMHVLWMASSTVTGEAGKPVSLIFKVTEGLMDSYDKQWRESTRTTQVEEPVGVLLNRLRSSSSK